MKNYHKYLSITKTEKGWGFYITTVWYIGINPNGPFPPLRIISEETRFVLFHHVWHRYKPDVTTGWEEYWVDFSGSYSDDILNKTFFRPQNPFIDEGTITNNRTKY